MRYRYYTYELPYIRPIRIGNQIQDVRRGVLINVRDEDGNEGWGEAAPLDGYGPDTFKEVVSALGQTNNLPPSLRFGMDCACRSVHAMQSSSPLRDWFGPRAAPSIENAFLVSGTESTIPRVVKTKVGASSVHDDVQRVQHILDTLPKGGQVRLDANGLWSKQEAFEFAALLTELSQVEFIEEPWEGCFRDPDLKSYPLPVAMDESFSSLNDPWQDADYVVLKPALFGALDETLEAIDRLRNAGKSVVLSSAFETSVTLHVLVALASQMDTVPGFGTYRYLKSDVGPRQDWLESSVLLFDQLPVAPGQHISLDGLKEVSI
ncbi:MAG: o-succinylbenzoate synthase [Rhodothermales bacterium]|nr:o-succinylbenzoate synthase [Rhodothermales bacterium]MDG2016642.1 o-succinylbenzoate synthase [Rhodothermales bacterium]HAY37479.1 hypothetical protein [Bacteroidota bacterium]